MTRATLRGAAPPRLRTAVRAAAAVAVVAGCAPSPAPTPAAPARLADTGLYADFAARRVAADALPFSPQYPLWSDGAAKRRWIRLPEGSAIDASDPDVWVFPVGTRLWKEFSFDRPIETRYLERLADGTWLAATYLWDADGADAPLAPERGARAAWTIRPGECFDVPARIDCAACHAAGPNAVLGFGALQLSSDRDPLAPHAEALPEGAVDLAALVERGLVRGLPAEFVERPPRIEAADPNERAVLGYLHSNCGHCHTSRGALDELGLGLDYPLVRAPGTPPPAIATACDQPSRFCPSGTEPGTPRVASGHPERSLLAARMGSRHPLLQMPPLATNVVDRVALERLEAWIRGRRVAAAETARL